MSKTSVNDGSKRTKVIILKVDSLTKYDSSKKRIETRYEYLKKQIDGLWNQYQETDDLSEKTKIRKEIKSHINEIDNLKKWNKQLEEKKSELESAAKSDLLEWEPTVPEL